MSDRTLKISDAQIDFVRLVLRSPDAGDGWRMINSRLSAFAVGMVDKQPELYEVESDGDAFRIKLSERGKILGDYL